MRETPLLTARRQPMRRPIEERYARIYEIVSAGKYPSTQDLADEIQVSAKTIARDIDYLRDFRRWPLEYDPHKHGFYFTGPVNPQLTPVLSQPEIFALVTARKAVQQYECGLDAPVSSGLEKLSWRLEDREQREFHGLETCVSFRPFALEHADPGLFELLTQSLREHRLITFDYRKPGHSAEEPRTLHPYHLVCDDNRWYIIGHDPKRKDIRTFALGRMSSTEIHETTFKIQKDFDIRKYLKGSMTVMRGTGDYEVVIEFDEWATDMIRGRRWQERQEFTELPSGSRLRMRLNNLEEVARWVQSWDVHANVVQPEALRNMLAERYALLSKRYAPKEQVVEE